MPSQFSRPKRVLIVDDETTLAFFLKQGLQESDVSCLADSASSGEEALTKLTYNSYDLLITDLKMSGISGFTLVEVARSLHPKIGVIVMTAFGSPEVEDEVARLQIDGYLIKPFPTTKLQDTVTRIILTQDKYRHNPIAEQNLSSSNEAR